MSDSVMPPGVVEGLARAERRLRALNVDLAVPRGALVLARVLADALKAACVPLDEEAGTARVVILEDAARWEIDLSDYRAPPLDAVLRRRDFTINAMAVPLADWLRQGGRPASVIDPLDGRGALARRELRACFAGTFEADPVRILRAFRFAAQLEFALAPSMEPLMRQATAHLPAVSGERIRDELLAVFETDRASQALQGLDAVGALEALMPELAPGRGLPQGDFHHLDVLAHEVEAVRQADRFLADFAEFSGPLQPVLAAYCAEEPVERRSRKALIKLAALLHDVGKPHS